MRLCSEQQLHHQRDRQQAQKRADKHAGGGGRLVGAVLVAQDRRVGGDGHTQKHGQHAQCKFIRQHVPQHGIRQQRHGRQLERGQRVDPPASEDLLKAHLRKRAAHDQHDDGACDIADIFDGLVQQRGRLPAGQIDRECRKRRRDARLPQHLPLKPEARRAAHQTCAVAPAEELEKQHEDRDVKRRAAAKQRLDDGIAEKAGVGEDEHEPVQPALRVPDAQQPHGREAQGDQRKIDQRDQPRQPERLPGREQALPRQCGGEDLHGVCNVYDERRELFVALRVHHAALCGAKAAGHAEKQHDHPPAQGENIHPARSFLLRRDLVYSGLFLIFANARGYFAGVGLILRMTTALCSAS